MFAFILLLLQLKFFFSLQSLLQICLFSNNVFDTIVLFHSIHFIYFLVPTIPFVEPFIPPASFSSFYSLCSILAILHSPSFPFFFFDYSSHLFSSCIFHVLPTLFIFVQIILNFSPTMVNIIFNDYTFKSKLSNFKLIIDAPPSSLMDSTTSPKVNTTKEGVGHVLWLATLQGKGVCWSSRIETRKIEKQINYSHKTYTNQTSWLVRNWSTLVHERTTSKHGPKRLITAWIWGKTPPSPL